MHAHIDCSIEGVVAHVTLRHAGKFNAMNRAMWGELQRVFQTLQSPEQAQLRAVVLRGHGGHFCAGGDISEYPDFRFDPAQLAHFHEVQVWGALQAMRDCDVPIIAAIEGNCMGGGLEIAACCDIRLAEDSARFGAPIAKLGFPMAPREMALIAEALGPHLARSLLLQAALLPAQRLWHSGFLLDCVPQGQMDAALHTRLQALLPLAPQAARLNKQTLRRLQAPAQPGDPDGSAWAYTYADSAEHREGIAAFLDKRAAAFSQYER